MSSEISIAHMPVKCTTVGIINDLELSFMIPVMCAAIQSWCESCNIEEFINGVNLNYNKSDIHKIMILCDHNRKAPHAYFNAIIKAGLFVREVGLMYKSDNKADPWGNKLMIRDTMILLQELFDKQKIAEYNKYGHPVGTETWSYTMDWMEGFR